MLKLTPEDLGREVNAARTFRRKHLQMVQEIERRYVGNWYSTDWSCDPTPENTIFSFLATMLPELVHAHPAAKITPARVWTHKDIADFLQMGLEAWMRGNSAFIEEMKDIVRDMITGWGVAMVGMEDRDHGDRRPRLDALHAMKPFVQHLPRHRYLIDPRAKKQGDSRWEGHEYDADLDDLSGYEHFDQEIVAKLVGGDPAQDDTRDTGMKPPQVGNREQVRLVDLWIRDTNQICTLAYKGESVSAEFIRPPTAYDGPPDGPYVMFGFYSVFNDPYPIGPLQPCMENIEEVNAHARAASDEAATFKNITLVDAAATDTLEIVKTGRNGGVYPVKGLSANPPVQLAVGQIHPERLNHIFQLRDRTDRTLGLGDNQRGRLAGVTATESATVQGNYDVRITYFRGRVEKFTHDVLRKVVDRLFYSPLVVMPVQKIDDATGMADEGTYYGGPQIGQENVDWIDFYLDITPQSMSIADDQVLQQLWVQCFELATQAAQGMATMPFINWRFMFDQWGETWNQKRLADVVFNPRAMAAFAQNPRMFGMGQPVPVPGDASPAITQSGLGVPALPPGGAAAGKPRQGGFGGPPPGAGGGMGGMVGGANKMLPAMAGAGA